MLVTENKILSWSKNIFFHHLFIQLRNPDSNKYSLLYFLFILILFLFFWLIFIILGHQGAYSIQHKKNIFLQIFQFLFLNLYDLIILRTFSLFYFEIIFNYLCHNSSLSVHICSTLLLLLVIITLVFYFKSFRLILKFDKKCKYIFDNDYMLDYDLMLLAQKILFCLEKNMKDIHCSFIIYIICIFISLYLIYLYYNEPSINFISTLFCGYHLSFLFLVVFYLTSPNLISDKTMFILYFISSFIGAQVCVIYLRKYKLFQFFSNGNKSIFTY